MILFLLLKSPKFHVYYNFLICFYFLQVTEKTKYIMLSFLVYGADAWALLFIMCAMSTATHRGLLKELNLLCSTLVCGIDSLYLLAS